MSRRLQFRVPVLALLAAGLCWHPATALGDPANVERNARDQPLFVIGVPAELQDGVGHSIRELFGGDALDKALIANESDELDEAALRSAPHVVAIGQEACAAVVDRRADVPVLCTLLYAEAFRALDCADACDRVVAIVMDQPPGRQARIARALYPDLQRFGVLRPVPEPPADNDVVTGVFEPGRNLSGQLADVLVDVDALIVEPRRDLYPRDSLRTVLLTAYGWDRPIIGYGPDWVRAGALVSAYSTIDDVLRDVRDVIPLQPDRNWSASERERVPSRFHIAENPAIARSLGLRRAPLVIDDRRFRTGDFGL